VLSVLLPGLGQMYAKQFGMGIAMAIAWVASCLFVARWYIDSTIPAFRRGELGLDSSRFIAGLILTGSWIYAAVDAASAPEREV